MQNAEGAFRRHNITLVGMKPREEGRLVTNIVDGIVAQEPNALHQGEGVLQGGEITQSWEQVRTSLRRSIGARMFDQWMAQVRLGAYCPLTGTVELSAPSDFSASFITSQFGEKLKAAWRAAAANVRDVRIVRSSAQGKDAPRLMPKADAIVAPEVVPMPARDSGAKNLTEDLISFRHSFDDFIVGESNRLAFSAARAMASSSVPLFNPLYIHGGTGQGKTHLLHAIANDYQAHFPGDRIIYMSAEKFMLEFVTAMRANESMAFKARLRAAKLLLVDDIQFIAGKGSTQEEFLHTINELAGSGARIVISADRAPHHLDAIDPRILSRLSGGLVADIQPADLDLRRTILEAKRTAIGAEDIPDMVLDFLARSIRTNIRELEGAFNKLLAYAQLTGRKVEMEFAQVMLADSVRANARRITVDEIQKACAAHYRIDASEMRSKRRARAVARPRQVAMYLAKKMTPRSLPEIGRIFGGRDHSTVIHAVRTIEGLRQSNPEIDSDIRALQRQLEL
jgi:chromosomal replication initiator protein